MYTRNRATKVYHDEMFGWSKPEKECWEGYRNSYKCGSCEVEWHDREQQSACWSCGVLYSTWGDKIEV